MTALRPLVALALVVAALPLVAGASWTVSTTPSFTWSPSSLTVAVGDTVTFTGGGPHTWFNEGGVMASCSSVTGSACVRTYASAGTFPFYCSVHPGMTGSVQAGPTPTTVAFASTGDLSGVATISGTVSSPGAAFTRVEVFFGSPTARIATLDGAGGWSLVVDTTTMANGAYGVSAKAFTASGAVAKAATTMTIANPAFVDLTVTNVAQVGNGLGTTATVSVSVRNAGNAASGTFRLALEYQYKDTWRPVGSTDVSNVAAFTTTSRSFAWTGGTLVGQFNLRATADALNAVAESNEGNNVRAGTAFFITGFVPGQDLRDPKT